MSKGSKQRPGKGYDHGYERIWGAKAVERKQHDLDYMRPIDKKEDITPDRLRFEAISVKYAGRPDTAILIGWCADLLEKTTAQLKKKTDDFNALLIQDIECLKELIKYQEGEQERESSTADNYRIPTIQNGRLE